MAVAVGVGVVRVVHGLGRGGVGGAAAVVAVVVHTQLISKHVQTGIPVVVVVFVLTCTPQSEKKHTAPRPLGHVELRRLRSVTHNDQALQVGREH